MRRSWHRIGHPGLVAGAVALVLLTLLAPASPLGAQTPPETSRLEILSVHHDPAGTLMVGIRADGGRDTDIQSLTMFVDDIPTTLDLGERETRDGLAVALVLDASGSMAGAWMRSARDAARALIEQLPAGDQVGIVSFATEAIVESGLTTDPDVALQAVDGINAEGWTALYDAVVEGARLLSDATEPSRVLVLLADGEDNYSVATAEESIQFAVEQGVAVYTVGIGRLFDASYLEELSARTSGEFVGMVTESDNGALEGLLARLGGTLGSRDTYTIPMRTLRQGTHTLNVRAVVNGQSVSANATFEVTNANFLQPSIADPTHAGDPIELRIDSLGSTANLVIEANVQGHSFRADSPSTHMLALDPWQLEPGRHEVEVVAFAGAAIAAREIVWVDVPELDPVLSINDQDGSFVARGRVQQVERPVIVAHSGGTEIARGIGELVVEAGTEPVSIELLGPTGEVLGRHELPAVEGAAAVEPASGATLALLPAAVALAGGAGWAWRRRRRKQRAAVEEILHRRIAPRTGVGLPAAGSYSDAPGASSGAGAAGSGANGAPSDERLGTITVRDASGNRTDVVLTRRPLMLGRAADCDIIVDDPEVRPKHARLRAISRHEVQIHALGENGARPFNPREEDLWLIAQSGEQIELGSHSVQIVMGAGAVEYGVSHDARRIPQGAGG